VRKNTFRITLIQIVSNLRRETYSYNRRVKKHFLFSLWCSSEKIFSIEILIIVMTWITKSPLVVMWR